MPVDAEVAPVPDIPFVYVLAHSKDPAPTTSEAVLTCLEDLVEKLRVIGCQLDDVVKITTYLPSEIMSVKGYAEYNSVYRPFFNAHGVFKLPARGSVGVQTRFGTDVQMEALAMSPPVSGNITVDGGTAADE